MKRWRRFAVCGPVPTTTSRVSWPERPAGPRRRRRVQGRCQRSRGSRSGWNGHVNSTLTW
jgi:hypothetical protein